LREFKGETNFFGEGLLNIVPKPHIYEEYRTIARTEPLLVVEGVLQKREGITNIIAEHLASLRQERDLSEVQGLIDKYGIDVEKIILMPEASDRETLIQRGRWLAEACKDKGYKFSNRLHILLWGNKRGT
jgi:organic radical activating enzyme